MSQPNSNRSPMVVQAAVRRLLTADHVLTDAQLGRLGFSGEPFPSLTLSVQPLKCSTPSHDVTFRALSRTVLDTSPTRLAHLAGTAAIRHHLQAPAEDWQCDPRGSKIRPDAVLAAPEGQWAVEFDAGYAHQAIQRKLRALDDSYLGIIWGVPSSARAQRLQTQYPALQVVQVQYW